MNRHSIRNRRWFPRLTCFIATLVTVSFLAVTAFAQASPLNILLTNDDGYDAPGIQILKTVLENAGHQVTIVAPLENQSGSGGSIGGSPGEFVNVLEQSPGVWSVESTPGDCVRAALGAVMADNRPDLVISGLNFGPNLGMSSSTASGTIGAAMVGLQQGIPSIAVSVGIDLAERGLVPPFPSTFESFEPAADFVVNLVEELQGHKRFGKKLLKDIILNVVFPVPYTNIEGVRLTRLAEKMNYDYVWQDIFGSIPNGGGPILINADLLDDPDLSRYSDFKAYSENFISITPLNGNFTTGLMFPFIRSALRNLNP